MTAGEILVAGGKSTRRQAASAAHRILLHCPDLILKSRNRSFFAGMS